MVCDRNLGKMSLPIMREMAPSIDAVLRVYGRVFIKELFKINPKNKKVVTFTDSVQGAADFASRFEDEHFINTLRTVIISSSNKLNYGLDELSNEIIIKLIAGEEVDEKINKDLKEKVEIIAEDMSKKIWSEFYKVANGQLAIENLSSEAKYEFNNLKTSNVMYLSDIINLVESSFLRIGMNPTNNYFKYYNDYLQSNNESSKSNNEFNWHWSDVYKRFDEDINWSKQDLESKPNLIKWKNTLKENFYESVIENISIQNDFEDLGLGI